jgi:hypothetical protein
MKHPLLSLALALFATAALAQTPRTNSALEGWLRLLPTEAVINHQYRYKFDPKRAQCFTARGEERIPTTCETLLGIGYADRARLTLSGDQVVRIDVLELQQ